MSLLAVETSGGVEVLQKAEAHLKARHSAERILRCWGGSGKGSFDELKEGIHKMLQVSKLFIFGSPPVCLFLIEFLLYPT